MGVLQPVLDLVRKFKGSQPAGESTVKLDKAVLLETIRETDIFSGLSPENLEAVFSHMEVLKVSNRQIVIREGAEGDYYYVLARGTARVVREGKDGDIAVDLTEPRSFGEEALISNRQRNATVIMTSSGVLLRLSKDAFNEYVKKPMVDWLFPAEAQGQVYLGAKWLDAREAGQAGQDKLPGAVMMPLDSLRRRLEELDKDVHYVCYCRNGRLSSTVAFLLRQRGYRASVLRGGLQAMKNTG